MGQLLTGGARLYNRAGGLRLPHRVLLNTKPHSVMDILMLIGDLREALPPE
jgi:hypothetical protein